METCGAVNRPLSVVAVLVVVVIIVPWQIWLDKAIFAQ
jgi:hypothetical protein